MHSAQVIFDREFVYTIPRGALKGVIFALHGCGQYPSEWGFASQSCPLCSGVSLLVFASARHDLPLCIHHT